MSYTANVFCPYKSKYFADCELEDVINHLELKPKLPSAYSFVEYEGGIIGIVCGNQFIGQLLPNKT